MQPNTVQTLFGKSINDGASYRAYIQNAGVLPSATNVWLEQAQADAQDSGAYATAIRTPLVFIKILNYGNRHALGEQLKAWCKRGTRGTLVTRFADDGLDYQLNCAAINVVQDNENPSVYVAQLESGDTHWRAVNADTDTWQATGTGGTKVITVQGGDETRLGIELTATGNPTVGYLYQNIYRLVNEPSVNFGKRPWCITINHAALVSGGKSQADGDDLRPVLNGKETPRWIADANTSATKIWFIAEIKAGFSLTLDTAIASSGAITEITFKDTPANVAALQTLPGKGILYHGTEWFGYAAKDKEDLKVTGITRALFGSTMQAHASGDAFKYIGNKVVLKYGNSTDTNPATDDPDYDSEKPLFDLSQSDNTKWVYTATTKFYDPLRPDAPGTWKPVLERLGKLSKFIYIKQDAETGDAAAGGKLASFKKNGVWQTEDGRAGFLLDCAGGFTFITLSGDKYRNTTRWPDFAGCQRSADGATWFNVSSQATPGSVSTWTAWSLARTAISGKYVFVGLDGQIQRLANAYASLEALTATVEFDTSKLPTGALLGETSNFTLNVRLKNNTTGNFLKLNYPMATGKKFDLDGEAYTATYDGANMHDAMTLNDEGRAVWIRLVKGSNTLALISPDCGTLDMVPRWYRRRL